MNFIEKQMSKLKNNIFIKMAIIGIMTLLLLIPTALIQDLIRERERTQKSAIAEVQDKWADAQIIAGPMITIPYYKYKEKYNKETSKLETEKVLSKINILPDNLNVDGTISPEKRKRGIYEIVVYASDFVIQGDFNAIDLNQLNINKKDVLFDKATLNIGISDLKGIEKQMLLNWNGAEKYFNPGIVNNTNLNSGVNVPIRFNNSKNSFEVNISLKGSQSMQFIPVGKTTDVSLASNWPTPSFTGNFLPDERKIDNKAGSFTANWSIFHLNRNFPQIWKGENYNLYKSAFGTNLLLPVDNYQKNYRVVRYAILFLALTFMTFFFVEVLNKVYMHPIQYLLVGLGLVLFFSLLLSFSEHFIFNTAYIISMLLTLALISLYTWAILKSKNIALLIFSVLFIMYGFIFTIIQLEGYSLLFGSLGLFAILAVVMYFSRKIDWYNVKLKN